MLGETPGKISARKIKMAMAVSGKNPLYHHHEIRLRHFIETFRSAGMQEDVVEAAYQAVLDGADEALQQVARRAERNSIEPRVWEAIVQGVRKMCTSL